MLTNGTVLAGILELRFCASACLFVKRKKEWYKRPVTVKDEILVGEGCGLEWRELGEKYSHLVTFADGR